ncbi:MAG: hypothetical protein MZV70_51300 [Desulfobacterales bacterium]|nr:hypothetical protein [Desulfobacterales bacterium]
MTDLPATPPVKVLKNENICIIVKFNFFLKIVLNGDSISLSFAMPGASCQVEYTSLPTGVELLTVIFTPPEPLDAPPVIFVPGTGFHH